MLHRATAILVVAFWLTMIGLLVRKEAGPEGSSLREVPVGHVMKLLLMHEQKSDLNIYSEKLRLGFLRIHPQMHKRERSRVIDFSGHVQLMVPGMERQRVQWDGELELEKTLATRRFAIGLTFRDPAQRAALASRLQVTVEPEKNRLTWSLNNGDSLPELPHTYTLDDAGLQMALSELADPTVVEMLRGQTRSAAAPVVKAHQSSILIHGQRMDTYLVTVEQSGQTLLEFDVSQLGSIVRAKTLIGWSLAPDDLMP
jgi:hypothetical protein